MKNKESKLSKLMNAVKADESLLDCFLEMIETTNDEHNVLETGDDAEDAVVSVIQKTGNLLLHKWAIKKNEEAEISVKTNKKMRPHEKKRSVGIPH